MYVTHPLLRSEAVEFRGYQANLARIVQKQDTLVVLPTGMGKTIVALLAMADALKDGAQRILVLAPTRPLVEQHGRFLGGALAEPWSGRVHTLTGTQSPEKRSVAYGSPGLVVATPQVIQNDLVGGRIDLGAFDWVVFDEAHRAVGDYAYAFIGQELQRRHPKSRRLGLTASPGHDVRKIDEVRHNLGLAHVEIRTPSDADVAPYVQAVVMEWEPLPLPPAMARVSGKLQEALAERVRALKETGVLKTAGSKPTRRELLELAGAIQGRLSQSSHPDPALYSALSLQAQAMKIQHAIEQVETQGATAFVEYLEGMRSEARGPKATKASRSVADDARVNEAYHIARLDTTENPKLGRTQVLVREQLAQAPDSRCIVFTHYRSTCETVAKALQGLPGVRPVLFVGQGRHGSQDGMSQKEQRETLERFKAGHHNVLVATSVAEEGLDIPETDLVVFFEPIPSEIRAIQRRGRTGRKRQGRVVVLMTKGTQDEAAHWSARRKEVEMVRELHSLRATLGRLPPPAPPPPSGQTRLDSTPPTPLSLPHPKAAAGPGPRVVFDHREQSGAVVRHLHELGCQLEARQLEVGDFILSDRVAVERKACADFVDSLVDGRLFEQLRQLKTYARPFLLLEGESLHGHRNVSPEAILGALSSVVVDYGIPFLQTRDGLETARFLHAVAKREQEREQRKIALRPAKPLSDKDQQLFLVAGLPGVSDVLAERLLSRFGSAEGVFAASASELAQVEGIGSQKASEIRRLLELEFAARRATLDAGPSA
jgi:Fanconi anemia group M protein